METIVIKLGGSIITDKSGYKKAKLEMISQLVKEISMIKGQYNIVLVHGAGSFGHAPVIKYNINNGIKTKEHKLGFTDTHLAVSQLSNLIIEELINNKTPAISLSPSILFNQKNKQINNYNHEIVEKYLKQGYLPVLYGDMVLDDELNGSVLSGDQIMKHVSKKLKATKMIFISDVEGVLSDGKVIPELNSTNIQKYETQLLGSAKADVTGGMYGKIKEIMASDIPTIITSPDNFLKAINGEQVGTLIHN